MPQPNTELATLIDAVRAGHGDLDGTVTELRLACEAYRSGSMPPPHLQATLERFSEELLLHFAEEELEETFGSLLTDQPRYLHRVDRLQKEHGDMTDTVTRLAEIAKTEIGTGFFAELDRLLDWLAVHEHAENTLMQELVLLDEGDSGG